MMPTHFIRWQGMPYIWCYGRNGPASMYCTGKKSTSLKPYVPHRQGPRTPQLEYLPKRYQELSLPERRELPVVCFCKPADLGTCSDRTESPHGCSGWLSAGRRHKQSWYLKRDSKTQPARLPEPGSRSGIYNSRFQASLGTLWRLQAGVHRQL